MNNIINSIKKELQKNIDLKYKEGATNYFKETIKPYGVRTPIVRKIARNYRRLDFKETIKLCEELLKSKYFEFGVVAFTLIGFHKKKFTKETFKIFESWVKKYVDNWAWCDFLCTDLIGYVIEKHPELINVLEIWTSSKNRWVRRAAAVSLIKPAKRGLFLKDVFKISNLMLQDRDDMVQKGVGWLLKETTNSKNRNKVVGFIEKNKFKMPRTMLRYSIEKLDEKTRKHILKSSRSP
ncbi:MAG: DNA alkylation repair protein [Nanoarchaeota archaeon]|nr:DNA alkylation repair protein [Nanoarchaeota archaeon]